MNINVTWDDRELLYGLKSLEKDVKTALFGSSNRLNQQGKTAWRNAMASQAVLSMGKNGKEWFSFNKKQWYMTNKWKVPDVAWAGRNFIKNKRQQAESSLAVILGQEKQKELDHALEVAFSKFK